MVDIKCPACLSTRIYFIRYLKGKRTDKYFNLYFCRGCQSLFNPSGYIEDDKALMADKDWHIEHFDMVSKNTYLLLGKIKTYFPEAKTLLDIGCGIGAAVLQAKSFGFEAMGVDPNKYAVEYARNQFSLDLKCDFFKPDLFKKKFDIITCTHILEHLENPRKLVREAIETLNIPGILFISVPFRRALIPQLIYILFPELRNTPFCDNDVHIIHFSHRSVRLMAEMFGAKSYKYIKDGWQGYIFEFR